MKRKKSILLILMMVPLLLFMSSAEDSHPSQIKDFLGKVVNFLVLFGGLAYLLRKPLGKFLQERSTSLAKMLSGAKKSREEAVLRLDEVETRMEKLNEEIEKLRQEAESEGQFLQQNIMEKAKKDADRLKRFAHSEIEMLTKDSLRDIKEYTAAIAADLARQRIRDQVTEEYQSSLIDKSIERLEGLYEKSNPDKKIRTRTD
jgi:F-type H+-transporting ATPase subunit b